MSAARTSLAWKIATANILLAVFAVLLAGVLQYRKERRILATTLRQELLQVVTSGALLIDGEKAEGLSGQGSFTDATTTVQVLRSLSIDNPTVARIYVLISGSDGAPRVLLWQGVVTEADPGSAVTASVRKCLEGGYPITTEIYEDSSDDQWLSAFHPLRDRQG